MKKLLIALAVALSLSACGKMEEPGKLVVRVQEPPIVFSTEQAADAVFRKFDFAKKLCLSVPSQKEQSILVLLDHSEKKGWHLLTKYEFKPLDNRTWFLVGAELEHFEPVSVVVDGLSCKDRP